MQWSITTRKESELEIEYHFEKRMNCFYLSSRWSPSAKSFSSNGFLGCPLGRLALWRLIHYNCRGSMSFHQLLQWRCSWSYSWGWTWWLIIYWVPLPVQAWGWNSVSWKGLLEQLAGEFIKKTFLKKGILSYLTVISKISIQSYASRMDWPTEDMGVPFLPPGVKKVGREVHSCPVMQAKGRKIWS